MLFQIILIAFALFAIRRAFLQYHHRSVTRYWLIASILLWAAVIVVALVPKGTDQIAELFGVARGADLLVYCAVVLLSYGVSRLLAAQQKISEELTHLTRELALTRAEEEYRDRL